MNITKEKQRQVIAKLIYDVEFRAETTTFLRTDDFIVSDYRQIYKAIKSLIYRNKAVNTLSIQGLCDEGVEIPQRNILDDSINYLEYARDIHKDGNEYRVKNLLDNFLSKSSTSNFKFEDELEKLVKDINGTSADTTLSGLVGGEAIAKFSEFIEESNHESVGLFGIPKIDDLIEGIERTHIYSIVAPSGVGKTMLGIQVMHESMKAGHRCMYLSNEMSNEEIVSRFLARESTVSAQKIRRNKFDSEGEQRHVLDKMSIIYDLFEDTSSVLLDKAHKPSDAAKAIRYYVMKYNIGLVIVDHIHNFRKVSSLYDSVAEVAHTFQELAQELNIAIVLLGQISLDAQKGSNVENVTAKGAKDVEEVSNVVMVLQRRRVQTTAAALRKDEDPKYMKIVVTKNRDGRTGNTFTFVDFPSMVIKQDD